MFWLLLASSLIIPLIMISVALLWRNNAPKKINFWYGFRTPLSTKNRDTWQFAHKHISKIWLVAGIAVLILTGVFAAIFHKDFINPSFIIISVQAVVLIASIFPTIVALKLTFNADGTRKVRLFDEHGNILNEVQNADTKQSPTNKKKTKLIVIIASAATAIFLIAVIGISVSMIFSGAKDPSVIVRDSNFQIKGMYGLTVDFLDINEIILLERTMDDIGVGRRVNGYGGTGQAFKGNFEFNGEKQILFVQAKTKPTIRIERKNNDADINISLKSGDATMTLFDELMLKAGPAVCANCKTGWIMRIPPKRRFCQTYTF